MKNLLILLLTILSISSLQAKVVDNKNPVEQIDVITEVIENINIDISYGYFVAIELESEIQGFMPLGLQNIQAQQLNNKTIVIYTYSSNFTENLGKIIITDSNCNKYSLNLQKSTAEKSQGDTAVYIKNSSNKKKCEAIKNNNFPRAGSVMYSTLQ